MHPSPSALDEIACPSTPHRITFPPTAPGTDQDEEWFEFDEDGQRRRLRLHDYGAIYRRPGLYESLVYQALQCRSPDRVARPLAEAVEGSGLALADLRVLDLGAGNGIVGELLHQMGVPEIVGLDILPEAADAARRDNPDAYRDYVVDDLARAAPETLARLREFAPNCLVTVAALGFGDIPPGAFLNAFALLPRGGWLAACIKDRFLDEDDDSGFGRLVRGLVADECIGVHARRRYVHRLSIRGEELHYVALIAQKRRDAS